MNDVFSVEVLAETGVRREIEIAGAGFTVGRDATCDVVLSSPAVSRFHLRVERSSGGLRLIDQSSNGTVVGDERIHDSTTILSPHTSLRVGPYALEIALRSRKGLESAVSPEVRRGIHRKLLDHLDLVSLDASQMTDDALRPRVVQALQRIIAGLDPDVCSEEKQAQLVVEMTDEVLGLGPLQELLDDDRISEIMVVDPETIYVERSGRLELTSLRFMDDESCRSAIERIVTPLGRRIDESTPLVDARLEDGSRVNAIIPPLAIRGPCITIRKFPTCPLDMNELVARGSLSKAMAVFLQRCVRARKNLIISGGTGSGKTTLLNVLSSEIAPSERIVTIEDAAELSLAQPHVVSLESKPSNLEGRGEYSIRDLLKNALRMRPDRIVVGECRGGEAIDMLQAMNTGHEGSMTTAHANSAPEAVKRIETLCLMAGLDLSTQAIREQIAASIHVIVQQMRYSDGSRKVTSITEIGGLDDDGELVLHDIFVFLRAGVGPHGEVVGQHGSTGYVPTFLEQFIRQGLIEQGDYL